MHRGHLVRCRGGKVTWQKEKASNVLSVVNGHWVGVQINSTVTTQHHSRKKANAATNAISK